MVEPTFDDIAKIKAAWDRDIAAQRAEIAALRKALEPFAKGWWEHQDPNAVVRCTPAWSSFDKRDLCTVGDIHRACAALSAPAEEGRCVHVDDLNDPILRALANPEPGQCGYCLTKDGKHAPGCDAVQAEESSAKAPVGTAALLGLTWRCTRCGRDADDAREHGCTRGPCPMELTDAG